MQLQLAVFLFEFASPCSEVLLPLCVCVCVRERECVCVCVCHVHGPAQRVTVRGGYERENAQESNCAYVCTCVRVRVRVRACVRACLYAYIHITRAWTSPSEEGCEREEAQESNSCSHAARLYSVSAGLRELACRHMGLLFTY